MLHGLGRSAGALFLASFWVCVSIAILPGCSSKSAQPQQPIQPPPIDTTDSTIVVDKGIVYWNTTEERRGSVRYGYERDEFDHMAYPVAANRRDKELRLNHQVPLLDLRAGHMLYYQVVNEYADARTRTFAPLDSFLVEGPLGHPLLTSTMINIGWGDCHLITMPNGKRFLIDAGEAGASASVRYYFNEHGLTSVDAMLATHVHVDHMGAMAGFSNTDPNALIRWLAPAVFFDSPQKSDARFVYSRLLDHLAAIPTRTVVLTRGMTSQSVPDLNLDPSVLIRVLNSGRLPTAPYGFDEDDQINNDSMVLKFSYGDVDFIIGGDAEVEAENSMRSVFAGQLDVEFYKAHHHGRFDGTTPAWANELNPRVSFFPNSDLASFETLEQFLGTIGPAISKLQNQGSHIYIIDEALPLGVSRTGRQHNVTFATDGRSYEVRIEWAQQPTPKPSLEAMQCLNRSTDHGVERVDSALEELP